MDAVSSFASTQSVVSNSALETLASHFDSDGCDVRLLRLRLRFGSPCSVVSGVAFRIVVDLVDEMAQVPISAMANALREAMEVHVELGASDVGGYEMESCHRVIGLKPLLQWRFDCVVAARPAASRHAEGFRLHVYSSTRQLPAPVTASHALLQSFCVGSQWIFTETPQSHVLILSVISDRIQVVSSHEVDLHSVQASSSLCLREFAIPSTPAEALLLIEEDYGEAMGSHIWDASIWMSVALIASSESREKDTKQSLFTMLELGAGCGMFAVVFARLASLRSEPFRMILTEKSNSIDRITANLELNSIMNDQEAVLRELMWGTDTQSVVPDASPVHAIFAADVLYHWSAHEALLATLEDLVLQDSETPVLVAHKHRGIATSKRLEAVISHGIDSQCETNSLTSKCRWSQWHVERLAKIANIDVLQLTRKKN